MGINNQQQLSDTKILLFEVFAKQTLSWNLNKKKLKQRLGLHTHYIKTTLGDIKKSQLRLTTGILY
jgi:hypothetical protein